jgi:hypothetical protein
MTKRLSEYVFRVLRLPCNHSEKDSRWKTSMSAFSTHASCATS